MSYFLRLKSLWQAGITNQGHTVATKDRLGAVLGRLWGCCGA